MQEAEQIKGQADAEVTKIYAEAYNHDPEFYTFFKTLESYEKTLGNNTKLVVPANSEFYKYTNFIQ